MPKKLQLLVPLVGPEGPQGPQGETGSAGKDGATFTPSVTEDGVVSWTNNGGLSNPAPVTIKNSGIHIGTKEPTNPNANIWILPDEEVEEPTDDTVYIPAPEVASVGQTIVVRAVDENGRPTEWEATDFPAGGSSERDWELFKTITIEEEVALWDIGSALDSAQSGNELGLKQYKEVLMEVSYVQPTSSQTALLIAVNNAGGGTWYRATSVLSTNAATVLLLHIRRVGELYSEILLGQVGQYATQYRVGYAKTGDNANGACCRGAHIVYLRIPQAIGIGSTIKIYGR